MDNKRFRSIPELFLHTVKIAPTEPAFQYPTDSEWHWISWQQAAQRTRNIAMGLLALGIKPEQRCAIQSSTRIEWLLADLGISCAAAATTTIYPSLNADNSTFILADSASKVIFAENNEQVEKIAANRNALPDLTKVVVFDGPGGYDGWVITLAELEAIGSAHDAAHPDQFDETVASIAANHLSAVIYTSGTTGRPKGVELTHDAWVYTGEAIRDSRLITNEDHQYLWLPMAHVFGKVLEVAAIAVCAKTTVDGRLDKLVDNLATIEPTFMCAVPRVFEKVYNRVVAKAAERGLVAYKMFRWALAVGKQASRLKRSGQEPTLALKIQHQLADRIVFAPLRARFGGQLRFMISGSAPLSFEVAEFFHAAGMLILEGYGLTETTGATLVNRPEKFSFGTVGIPFGSTEVSIAEEDGEILIRGRCVMRGYHNHPEMTAEVLTKNGWFRTGDIGEIDADGFLRVTDRKKDLIKTSGGKYVSPQLIETKLKTICPYVSHVLVHGDQRNYCTALVTLDEAEITQWAKELGIDQSYRYLTEHPQMLAIVQSAFDTLNAQLASFETIKHFAILPEDFTQENGELTANLKVRRKIVEKKYRYMLNELYYS